MIATWGLSVVIVISGPDRDKFSSQEKSQASSYSVQPWRSTPYPKRGKGREKDGEGGGMGGGGRWGERGRKREMGINKKMKIYFCWSINKIMAFVLKFKWPLYKVPMAKEIYLQLFFSLSSKLTFILWSDKRLHKVLKILSTWNQVWV